MGKINIRGGRERQAFTPIFLGIKPLDGVMDGLENDRFSGGVPLLFENIGIHRNR